MENHKVSKIAIKTTIRKIGFWFQVLLTISIYIYMI